MFSIDGGSTYVITSNFPNLSSGAYNIMVSDASGCTASTLTTIAPSPNINIDSIITLNDSCSACQGEIKIYASGSGPFNYSIDNGFTTHSTNVFENLCSNNYDIVVSSGVCNSSSNAFISDLGSLADATITAPSEVCIVDEPISLSVPTSGGVWSGNGVDPMMGIFNPGLAGQGTHTITYSIGGACGGSDTENIVVTDTVNPRINPVSPVCITQASFNLTAIIPGGTWSGNGIVDPNNGTFDPEIAGSGTHKILYTLSGVCSDSDSIDIVVSDTISPIIDAVGSQCTNNTPFQLISSIPGGIWSGEGITDPNNGTFDPSIALVGSHTITYSINIGACSNVQTILIDVNQSLDASITPAGPFCTMDSSTMLIAVDPGGTWSGVGINPNTGVFNPQDAGPGNHQIIYSISGECGDADTIFVEVTQQPDASITTAPILCVEGDPIQLIAASINGIWTGDVVDSNGIFTPTIPGNFLVTYSIDGFCGNSDQITVVVEDNPIIEVTSTINNTCSGTEVTLSYTSVKLIVV